MPRLTPNQEYCSIARALELLGERWTLHIVRDLLTGPKRFSDLKRLVVGVTPKWLTARLRALESAGVVEHDGREYRLTAHGQALRPALEELSMWSTTYDARPPHSEETIIPEHDMWALEVYLNRQRATLNAPVTWIVDLGDEDRHALSWDADRWTWTPDATTSGDVTLATTPRRWSILLFNSQTGRPTSTRGYRLAGDPKRVAEFRTLFALVPPRTLGAGRLATSP